MELAVRFTVRFWLISSHMSASSRFLSSSGCAINPISGVHLGLCPGRGSLGKLGTIALDRRSARRSAGTLRAMAISGGGGGGGGAKSVARCGPCQRDEGYHCTGDRAGPDPVVVTAGGAFRQRWRFAGQFLATPAQSP